ncbi:MAG: nicotinate-nucleotide--dimethylbenzimidazole phosphoribosyltransferase [Bdellovibrionia bacterium]
MENILNSTIAAIEPKCREFEKKATCRIEQLTMPHWALGSLLDLGCDLVAMTRSMHPKVARKSIFIMAADHGIAAEGVSLYPKEVTVQMVRNFVQGGAAINALSRQVGSRTIVVDMGVDGDLTQFVKAGQVVGAKVRHGTRNFLVEPAMTRDEALEAITTGIHLAQSYGADVDVFGTGDMGIANTTSSAAIAAVLLDCPVETVVGRGTGIDDQRLAHKTHVIESAIRLHHLDLYSSLSSNAPRSLNSKEGLDVLQKVGGFEIAAIAGLILGAASIKRPVVVDGYISTAGALIAQTLCPTSMDYVIASHASQEKGHQLMLAKLGKRPLLDLGMRLGEGTGAALAMNLVEAAVRIITEVATFESAKVSEKIA